MMEEFFLNTLGAEEINLLSSPKEYMKGYEWIFWIIYPTYNGKYWLQKSMLCPDCKKYHNVTLFEFSSKEELAAGLRVLGHPDFAEKYCR